MFQRFTLYSFATKHLHFTFTLLQKYSKDVWKNIPWVELFDSLIFYKVQSRDLDRKIA